MHAAFSVQYSKTKLLAPAHFAASATPYVELTVVVPVGKASALEPQGLKFSSEGVPQITGTLALAADEIHALPSCELSMMASASSR